MFGDFGFASGRRKFMCLFRRHISNRNAARDEPHQTCTGTKKTQVLNFKVHQTCTGTKKTKVLNFKVHQTCTGTKKTKTFQSTWEGASIPLKFLFFLFFLSLCRFGALWSSKLLFFLSLCRFGALWSSKLVFFCPCAGLVSFDVQLFISIVKPWFRKPPNKVKKTSIPTPCERIYFNNKPWVTPNLHRHKTNIV